MVTILSHILPLPLLVKITGQRLFLPFYHTVSDNKLPHIQHLYTVKTVRSFEKELDFILKYFKPISAQELTVIMENQLPLKENYFLLSFDDGLKEIYDTICPVLKRKGVPALFFLNSAFVDNNDLFFRYKASLLIDTILKKGTDTYKQIATFTGKSFINNTGAIQWILSINYAGRNIPDTLALMLGIDFKEYLKKYTPYLTKTQIAELAGEGFEFGAHSVDHPYFKELTLSEQLQQANDSIGFVTSNFGEAHNYFSFPFFDDGVPKEFYQKLFSKANPTKPRIIFGSSGLKQDEFPFVLHRLCMEKGNNGINFVLSEYFRRVFKVMINRNIRKHELII